MASAGGRLQGMAQWALHQQGGDHSNRTQMETIIYPVGQGVGSVNVRSSSPASATSVGQIASPTFKLFGRRLNWKQLSETSNVSIFVNVQNVTQVGVAPIVQSGPVPGRMATDPETPWGSNWGGQQLVLPDDAAGRSVSITFGQHTTEAGYGWATLFDSIRIDDYFATIQQPEENEVFPYAPQSPWNSGDVTYSADVTYPAASVDWTVDLQYRTSGNRCTIANCDSSESFSASPGMPEVRQYARKGGRLTVNAVTAEGTPVCGKRTAYVTATPVPEAAAKAHVLSLYAAGAGATPELTWGIAMRESTGRHFCRTGVDCTNARPALYGVDAYWPSEAGDGGSHVGLMMSAIVAGGMTFAWDWMANANWAIDTHFIGFCRGRAVSNMNTMKNALPPSASIRDLSATELENIMLGCYTFGDRGAFDTYYRTYRVKGNNHDWQRNTSPPGQPPSEGQEVINYATQVRAFCNCPNATPVP
jgi:hypothetical protein